MKQTGGSNSYYLAPVTHPNQAAAPYTAECGDIIESLGMTFSEGCAFKAIWRKAAERTLGLKKPGGSALYDAEKVEFYGKRMQAEVGIADCRLHTSPPPAPKARVPATCVPGPDWVDRIQAAPRSVPIKLHDRDGY